jgi:DNA-binding SARP family transcriptional activator
MGSYSNKSGWDESIDYTNGGQWQDTIQLLKLMQRDYQGVRRQLEWVNNNLAGRESLLSQHLQYALQLSGGYQILRLLPYSTGGKTVGMGRTTLGVLTKPRTSQDLIRLEVNCFGNFEIRSTWKKVERWRSVKAKTVFQYLLMKRRQPVVKEVLMEMLWPDYNPRAASNNLKAAVHVLRQTLNKIFEDDIDFDFVLSVQGSYLINPLINFWLDVEEFEQHYSQGQSYEKGNKSADAIREYEMAKNLYRGDFLENEPYEEWTLLRREALKDIYLIILSKLADNAMITGDYNSCIDYSQKILAKDSCREDAYRRLMYCHDRLGQRNRALRWYEICRQIIKTELDTVPNPETNALYEQLLKNIPI